MNIRHSRFTRFFVIFLFLLTVTLSPLFVIRAFKHLGQAVPVFKPAQVYDFGEVEPGRLVRYTFKLANDSTEPLGLLQAKSPCSCTVPTIQNKTVPPGEEIPIPVVFDSSGLYGNVHQRVLVETDSIVRPIIAFDLIGLVKFPLEPRNPKLHFDYRRDLSLLKRTISIFSTGLARGALLSVRNETVPSYLSVELVRLEKDVHRLDIQLNTLNAPNQFSNKIVLNSSASEIDSYIINVTGQNLHGLVSFPALASFGLLNETGRIQRSLMVSARDPTEKLNVEDLEITVKVENGIVRVADKFASGSGVSILLELLAYDAKREVSGYAQIKRVGGDKLFIPIKSYTRHGVNSKP